MKIKIMNKEKNQGQKEFEEKELKGNAAEANQESGKGAEANVEGTNANGAAANGDGVNGGANAKGTANEGAKGDAANGESNEAAEPQKELTAEELVQKKIAQSEQKAAEAADKYVRLAAEFDNYRRRTAKERLDLIATAGEDVIKGLLPILDDCERALQVLRESKDSAAAIEGTELIYNKLMGFLKGKGLAVIEAKDKELDTEFHEAVAQFPVQEKKMKNKVIDVVQQGYTLNGKVIRYAKVVVGM